MNVAHDSVNQNQKSADLTVIVPLYNKQNTISRCLASISSQTVRPVRVIVIDDKSTDTSLEKVKTCNYGDTWFEVVEMPVNSGVAAARNYGARLAITKYIAFLDADDAWMPQFVETVLPLLSSGGAGFAASNRMQVDERSTVITRTRMPGMQEGIVEKKFWSIFYPYLPINSSCNILARVSFEEVGGFPTSMKNFEDFALWSQLWARNKFSYAGDELSVIYKDSAGASARRASFKDILRLTRYLIESCLIGWRYDRPGASGLFLFFVKFLFFSALGCLIGKRSQYRWRKS